MTEAITQQKCKAGGDNPPKKIFVAAGIILAHILLIASRHHKPVRARLFVFFDGGEKA